ncbi:MAG TPA: hypothetical protein VFU02_11710 [Polyangiaceae bacterium]|nr:hypothetical protein [Polyangiaceae bacterium]
MTPRGSDTLVFCFVAMPLVLVGLLLWALAHLVRRGELPPRAFAVGLAALALWLLLWGLVAHSGVLNVWDGFPPRAFPAIVALFVTNAWLAFSRVGRALAHGLSFRWLIGFQVFRLPLELMLHRAMVEGLMPPQMSFEGLNFDIVTGVSAGLIAFTSIWVSLPRWVYWAFNLLGSTLLAAIVSIAIVSMPTFAVFGPDRTNTWVFGFPYVYLPAVMVQWALLGHLLVFRKLRITSRAQKHV